MSIHPQYAAAIMSGKKRIEFRKRRLAPDILTVWVYATSPVQAVVGTFQIREVVELSPRLMWRRYGADGCIDKRAYDAYYKHHKTAVGLVIESFLPLDTPIALGELLPSGVPPQSFAYVSERMPASV
ncbi:ASCH domain-containing protein [Tsukamurella ocularis]|uniref:ASCH domain-containing protein n=1 Tax=Tsukamurella ocularis TaxID=1970234 RepID=UPI0039EF3702